MVYLHAFAYIINNNKLFKDLKLKLYEYRMYRLMYIVL